MSHRSALIPYLSLTTREKGDRTAPPRPKMGEGAGGGEGTYKGRSCQFQASFNHRCTQMHTDTGQDFRARCYRIARCCPNLCVSVFLCFCRESLVRYLMSIYGTLWFPSARNPCDLPHKMGEGGQRGHYIFNIGYCCYDKGTISVTPVLVYFCKSRATETSSPQHREWGKQGELCHSKAHHLMPLCPEEIRVFA
jgi:hypothetical protein